VSLDPVLAAARELDGRPRFHPPGDHPATFCWRKHLAALEAHRERLDDLRPEFFSTGQEDHWRRMVKETDEMIAYVRTTLAAFEEGESIAKANYLRIVERP
jgi:hypothetical protein